MRREDIHEEAREDGLEWLGTVHTHPNCYPVPSEGDNIAAREIQRAPDRHLRDLRDQRQEIPPPAPRTKLQWWPAQYPLPVVNA